MLMKAIPVIIWIVIILALVSLPGAAMISKDDLLASYTVPGSRYVTGLDPDIRQFSDSDSLACCSNGSSMNYSSVFDESDPWPPEPEPDDSIPGGFPPSWVNPMTWYVESHGGIDWYQLYFF
jgi:hypothetical protein